MSKDAATHERAPILVTFLPPWQTPDRNDLKKSVIWFMYSVGHGRQRKHGRIHGGKSLSRSGTKREQDWKTVWLKPSRLAQWLWPPPRFRIPKVS